MINKSEGKAINVYLEDSIRYYVLYMDVVGSSASQLDLEEQIDRISEFNRILSRILFSKKITKDGSPQWKMGYYGSTGDGAVICFNSVRDPFRLTIRLLADISKRDKRLPDNCKFYQYN